MNKPFYNLKFNIFQFFNFKSFNVNLSLYALTEKTFKFCVKKFTFSSIESIENIKLFFV